CWRYLSTTSVCSLMMSWVRLAPERARKWVCMSSRALVAATPSTVVSVENSATAPPRMARAARTAMIATPCCSIDCSLRFAMVVSSVGEELQLFLHREARLGEVLDDLVVVAAVDADLD